MSNLEKWNGLIYWTRRDTYLGHMTMAASDLGLCRLSFDEDESALSAKFPNAILQQDDNRSIFVQTLQAIENGGPYDDIKLDIKGTLFQQLVWQALRQIPAGETRSYGDIARAINRPKACRAVGSANAANNIAIIIPCHRVIGSDGALAGYAYGSKIKQKLLSKEGAIYKV